MHPKSTSALLPGRGQVFHGPEDESESPSSAGLTAGAPDNAPGAMSPYPTVVIVVNAQYTPATYLSRGREVQGGVSRERRRPRADAGHEGSLGTAEGPLASSGFMDNGRRSALAGWERMGVGIARCGQGAAGVITSVLR